MNRREHGLAGLFATCSTLLVVAPAYAQTTPSPSPVPPTQPAFPTPSVFVGHDVSDQISEYIRCIFQDRDGYLWLGTNSDGVCRYDNASLVYYGRNEGLAGNAVRDIAQTADGAMWFTTEQGVSRYHDGTFTNYTVHDGLTSNDTWSLMLDRAGTLWVGTREGVCRYLNAGAPAAVDSKDEATVPSDHKPFEPFAIPRAEVETPAARFDPRLIWSMFEDRDGNIWFGTDGEGVRKFDGTTFATYTTKDGLGGNQVRSVFEDRHGMIWIAGDGGGVTRFDGKTFQRFTTDDGLPNNRVYLVFEDRTGDLWFSTLAQGATRYDGKEFTVFSKIGNLERAHVQSMLQDKDGTLWFGCSGGLFRFDGQDFINVTKNGPWK